MSPRSMADHDMAVSVGAFAAERVKRLEESSQLPLPSSDLMRLEWDDLFVEELLGVGGFASVYLATCPKLWQRQNKGSDNMENSSSVFSHDHSWALSERSGTSMMSGMSLDESTAELTGAYAVKYLSNRTMADPKQYVTGAGDLAGEAFLLSRLSHPNIIQLYGITAGDVSEAFTKRGGLFLVLEALDTTLTQELHAWRKTPLASLDDFVKQNQQSSVPSTSGRLDIAAEIAKGMHYLHSHDIIFRDLKPDNVGFDRTGGVRLFDFGLAREVNKKENRLNGVAGSMMYMAPETVLGKFSCKSSDVYSFGILLWELMSLERPFPEFDQPNQLQKAVSIDGHRPSLSSMPERVAALIRSCWQSNHDARPLFLDIIPSLRALKKFRKQKRVLSDA